MNKICCLIPSLGPGGMEKVMSELISFFHKKPDLEVHVILFGRKREMFFEIPNGVKVHKPGFEFKNKYRTIFTIKTIFFLRQKIKAIDPSTLLSFGEDWNNMVLLSTMGLDYPVFVSDRAEPGKKRRFVQEFLRRTLYPFASGIIIQTTKAKEIYEKSFPGNAVRAIPNPFINGQLNQTNSKSRENIVLSVGRLIETKHYDLLIEIFSKIEEEESWKLVIVGGNAVKQNGMERLKELIAKKNLKDRVILTGTVSDVESWYRKSKIFAFTSSSEGFPNVVGEAMQYHLPVIAFDCVAGPSDLIEDGVNGYLVPLFDTGKFKNKLSDLMKNDLLRNAMGVESAKKIKGFSLDNIGDQFLEFILPES